MGSTGHTIGRRPYLIILPLPYWDFGMFLFVLLFVNSMICNPNIYSSSIEGPKNK